MGLPGQRPFMRFGLALQAAPRRLVNYGSSSSRRVRDPDFNQVERHADATTSMQPQLSTLSTK